MLIYIIAGGKNYMNLSFKFQTLFKEAIEKYKQFKFVLTHSQEG